MKQIETITVRFFKEITNCWGETTLREVIVNTKKATIEEAYRVAVALGANPRKLIEYTTNK